MKPGEPSITRRAVHDSGDGNLPIRRIVIHVTCPGVGYPQASKKGAASGTAKYFQMQSSGGSAHYIYDSSRDEQHCVPEDTIAWHAPPNPHTIGIEICGEATYTRAQWLSAAVWPAVEEAAARTRELCTRYDLPMRKLSVAQVKANAEGVCGHIDVSQAFRQTDHSDPGPGFPWDEFMHLVNRTEAGPPAKPASTPTEDAVKELPMLKLGAGQGKESSLCWDVKTLAGLLYARGFPLPDGVDDTVFGVPMQDALRAFQKDKKLNADSICGPLSWAALLRVS